MKNQKKDKGKGKGNEKGKNKENKNDKTNKKGKSKEKDKKKEETKLIGKKRNISEENDSDNINEEEYNKQSDDKNDNSKETKKNFEKPMTKELDEMMKRAKAFIEQAKKHPLTFTPPEKPEIYPETKALKFEVVAEFNKARAGILTLPHGQVLTPIYMPVGTKGAMKGLLSVDLERMGCKLMLSNTYHLALEPGGQFLNDNYGKKERRAIHNYMNWKNNVLTDSGGFQIGSLPHLSERNEKGVEFISHASGDDRHLILTPELSMETQNNIGSDIIMALDDVISALCSENEVYDACERSLRWLDRCIKAHKRKNEQNLYGIVQGGIDLKLRKEALIEWVKRNLPGYAIGGMAGGETKEDFCKTVDICTDYLPKNKPRYLMGIGYPVDLVICALLGVDQFDCVFATRTARFGTALTDYGFLKIKAEKNKYDFSPIDPNCQCEICKKYSRSYLYFMLNTNQRAIEMISFHNVYYLLNLMKRIRNAIIDKKVNEFVKDFITKQYKDSVPDWVIHFLQKAGCDMSFIETNSRDDLKSDKNQSDS